MTNTRGKRRGTRYMFSRQFRKHGKNKVIVNLFFNYVIILFFPTTWKLVGDKII